MRRVEQLEQQVQQLDPQEFTQFRDWFLEFEWDAWDREVERDAKAGKQKAKAICSGCHGIAGTKTAYPEVFHVPRIGGQNEAYLVAALNAYRSGERYSATMKGLATALTEKDVMDIAAYYAGIESVK